MIQKEPLPIKHPFSMSFMDLIEFKKTKVNPSKYPRMIAAYVITLIILAILNGFLAAMIVAKQKLYERMLKKEKQLDDLYNNAPCGYFSLDEEGFFSLINNTALQWLGYNREELINKIKFSDLLTENSQKKFNDVFKKSRYLGLIQDLELKVIHKNGSSFFILLNLNTLQDNLDPDVVNRITIYDITNRNRQLKEISKLAYHDSLTNLSNRKLFTDRLNYTVTISKRHNRSFAVLFLDLDKFKNINDTLGHDIGDRFLKKVSSRLQNCVRESDTIARLGGDEFAIILNEIEEYQDAAEVAKKILHSLSRPIYIKEFELQVSISIGIAVQPTDGIDTAHDLLRKADIAMYAAKFPGGNNYKFYNDIAIEFT